MIPALCFPFVYLDNAFHTDLSKLYSKPPDFLPKSKGLQCQSRSSTDNKYNSGENFLQWKCFVEEVGKGLINLLLGMPWF